MRLTDVGLLEICVITGLCCGLLAGAIELDPTKYFFYGVALMYMAYNVMVILTDWWQHTPPFLGWHYWIGRSFRGKQEKG